MSAISETSIYSIINPLFAAAKNKELFLEHKCLYTSISNAILHMNSLNADHRTAVSLKVNQLFTEHPPEDHKHLLNFLKNFSIKKADGSYEGFIKPLQEYFTSLDVHPQQQFLSLASQSTKAPSFSPREFMADAFDLITENAPLEQTLKTIFDILSEWKTAAKKDYQTTNKMHLIEKTNALVSSLKELTKPELEYLQVIFSQRYTNNDWESVIKWVAKNSFSEFDGAYKSLNDLMTLIFDLYFFPFPEGFGPESKILRHIDTNKTHPAYNFKKICEIQDIRRCIFDEPETLHKIKILSKAGEKYFKEDVLHAINMGLISNQDVGLKKIGLLFNLFKEEGCKQIKRLDLILSPREAKLALDNLKNYFPSVQYLSLRGDELNFTAENALKTMPLVELELYDFKSFTQFNFLQHLTQLKKLAINKEININHLPQLLKLEDLNLYVFDENTSSALKTLTHLKKLTLQFGDITDHSFLENFKDLTYLNLQGQKLSQLTLNKQQNLTTLMVENGVGKELSIQGLPLLSCLSLNNSKIDKVHLENLPELRELSLDSHYINTSLLQNCKITKLQFNHNKLLSDCTWLMNFPLKELDISSSNVSNLKMISQHPTLETINVSKCRRLIDLRDLLKSKSLKTIILGKWNIDHGLMDQFTNKGIKIIKS